MKRPSGCDVQDDFPAFVRSTSEHLVRSASVFQRKDSADVRNYSSTVEQVRDLGQPRRGHIHMHVRCANAIAFLCSLGNGRDDGHENPTWLQHTKRLLLRVSSNRI